MSFRISNKKCILTISDNGVGLSDKIDINKSKTLGLKLVSTIVRAQLFGDFLYENKTGSTFKIIFEYNI